jgi:hypothetical protein
MQYSNSTVDSTVLVAVDSTVLLLVTVTLAMTIGSKVTIVVDYSFHIGGHH